MTLHFSSQHLTTREQNQHSTAKRKLLQWFFSIPIEDSLLDPSISNPFFFLSFFFFFSFFFQEWLSPEEALRGFQNKEKWLPPPTWINTYQLSKLKLEEIEEQKRDLAPILPIMKKNDTGFTLLLPEDYEHGENNETKIEHRALVNTKEREIEYRKDGQVIHATQLFSS